MKSMKSTVKRMDEEEMLKILNEEAPVGVCIVQDGKFCYFNSNFPIATGYTADELVDKDPLELIVPEDREMVRENEIKMLKGELIPPYQFRVIHKDGSIRWIMEAVRSVQYHGRRAVLGNYMEITERKEMEEALRQSEERYRTILEEMEDAYFEVDLGGHFTFVNNSMCHDLGYSVEELIGMRMSYKGFTIEEDIESVFRVFNEVYRTGVPNKGFPWRIIRKDGSHEFAETSVSPLRNDKGEIIGFRGIGRDITERKKMEEVLRRSEERYRTILEETGDGYFETDLAGNSTFVNDAQTRLLGYSREEIIGMNFRAFTPEEKVKAVFEAYNRMYKTGEPLRSSPTEIIRKDGSHGFAETSAFPIRNDKGEIIGFRGVRRDITERKKMEEALRQSEEKYRTILEEMEDSYFEVDLGGHLTFVNNSVCRDLGYSREELIGMNYKGFTIEEDIESVFRVFNEVYRTGVPNKGFPWKTIRKDGSHGFAETSISLLRNDKGEIIGFRGVGRDITERKQAEEKLRQSEENYKTLFNNSVVGMYVMDIETSKIVMGNRAAREMAGVSSAEEGIGINPFDFVVPEDRSKVLDIAINEFLQDSRQTHEVQVMDKNGRRGWQSFSIARITHQGRLASLVSIMDITERKQAEEKVRQSKENYRALFESSVIGAVVVDAETMEIIMANQATMKMFGFSSPEAGINPLDFSPTEDRQRNLELIVKEVFEKDSRESTDLPVMTKDGRKIWVSVTGARITYKGKLAGLLSFTDITERKRMEEALRQSEENYRALFDSTVIGTFVLDAETMKVVIGNQAAAKMFGFSSADEAIGINPLDFIPPEDREKVLEIAVKELFEQDLRRTHELQAITKDGRKIWASITGARIMHEGRLAGLISFTDITEQKQQNERLMLTDRLASLGELASGTAHELNNPLTSIIGFSQLLMEKEVPDDIREDLKLIYSEAQRAASVTKNLLTFARKHAPVKQRDQINNIIEDVLKLRTYEHKVSGIEVEGQLDPDLPKIMVDYFQMQQVFMNIIINAEYFMTKAHNKGTLTITTKKQSNTVMISIADDGPGIPPENLKRIFDPFFTTKEAGKGTGLGLSICHGIVTEHGGQIYARSQLGKGATIFVELPINSRDHIGDMFKTG
ncbi:MAG: PAS domain S-box protein [Dehalococcoidia bacterium]|nr:PAS domain S-box protein [Dehalococcoidia bacterium]